MEKAISLNEIGLYNPQRQSADVTKALFVVRQKQFNSLLGSIIVEEKNSRPQHHLIIGQRGMGKTTLLKRIEVELHEEPYRKQFIPLLFPEEQYNVKNLATFWLNCLDALANSLEVEKYPTETIAKIDNTVKELSKKTPEIISEESYKFLRDTCRDLQRRPVLLIDNIDLVFNRLKKQGQHDLRSVLNETGAPIIIGGSVAVTSYVTQYDMPFYDFFQVETLAKLSYEEFVELLTNLATVTHCDEIVFKSLKENTARPRALYDLTGGNPRITVVLFKFIQKGFTNDIITDLEALADEATPLYKAKYEDLSEQQQIVLDAIAMNWDPIPLNQLSQVTDYSSEQLSAPLYRLKENGWLETTSAQKAKGNAYSISERFFNIWFIMRCSRRNKGSKRNKAGVNWLLKFLESYYGKEKLEEKSDVLLQQKNYSAEQVRLQMAISESTVLDSHKRKQIKEKLTEMMIENEDIRKEFVDSSIWDSFRKFNKRKLFHLTTKIKPGDSDFCNDIGFFYWEQKQYDKALVCFNRSTKINQNDEHAWRWKAVCFTFLKNYAEANKNYDIAIKLAPTNSYVWYWKGNYLFDIQKYAEAIVCYEKAVELNPNDAFIWYWQGECLSEMRRYENASDCYNKAIELDKKNSLVWRKTDSDEIKTREYKKNINPYNQSLYRYCLHITLFELREQNQGIAKEYLLQTFEALENENKILTIANDYWWTKFGSDFIKVGYGSWFLDILEEKGYDIVLSPFFTAIQALEIEKQDSKKGKAEAEIYLRNRAVEISEPARIIIEKMRKLMG